jgi:hypothetical protein
MPVCLPGIGIPSAVGGAGGSLPPPVSNFAAVTVSTTRIDLSWDDALTATGFDLDSSPDSSTWSPLQSNLNALAYSNTGLSAGTHRFYRIRARNAAGAGAWSAAVSAYTPPPQVTGLTAVANGTGEIDLGWSAATGATIYDVQRRRHGTSTWATIASQAGITYNDTGGLLAGTQYDYQVRARNPGGSGAYSSVASATTDAGTNTLAVGLVVALNLDEASGNAVDQIAAANLTASNAPGANTARCGMGRTFNGTTQGFARADSGIDLGNPGAVEPYRFGAGRSWEVEGTFNPDPSVLTSQLIWEKGDLGGAHFEAALFCNLTNKSVTASVEDGGKSITCTDNELVGGVDNTYRIQYDHTAQTLTLWVNGGQPRVLTSVTTITERGAQFSLGLGYSGQFFKGRICRFFKWDRTKNDAEALYMLKGGLSREYAEVATASPVSPTFSAGPTLISDPAAAYCSNTGLVYHPATDHYYLVYRQSTAEVSPNGVLHVKRCPGGSAFTTLGNWTEVATLTSPLSPETDIRDPHLNVLDDGSLQITAAASNNTSSWKMVGFFSANGTDWTSGTAFTGLPTNYWLWRWESKPGGGYMGTAYSADQDPVTIIRVESVNGCAWTVIDNPFDGPNESTEGCFIFRASDDAAVYFARQDTTTYNRYSTWTASPYTSWVINDTRPTVPSGNSSRMAAPQGLELPSGILVVWGRAYTPNQRYQLDTLEPETGFAVQYLAGSAQTEAGYGGMVYRDGKLKLCWYDTSGGKAQIWVAEMDAPA